MTTAPVPVQMWKCHITGKLFDTQEGAIKSAKNAKARKTREANKKKKAIELSNLVAYQSNFIRLNATDIGGIPELMKLKAKEFWGIDINVAFTGISFRAYGHTEGPHWSFCVEMSGESLGKSQLKALRDLGLWRTHMGHDLPLAGTILQDSWGRNPAAFSGIRLGSGSGARFGDKGACLRRDAVIYLKDFPLLEKKYKEYLRFKEPDSVYRQQLKQIAGNARVFADSTRSVSEQRDVVNELRSQLEVEEGKLKTLHLDAQEQFKGFCLSKLVAPPVIPGDLANLFE
jgi:hypothetical protein